MKKLKIITFCLLLASGAAYGQSTLNATGGGGTIAGNTYDYSIGEMTLVSTESGSNIIITQGLLQPTKDQTPDAVNDIIITQDQLTIYPNPSSAVVNIQPTFDKGGTMNILLLDATGKTIQRQEYKLANGNEKQEIDISSLANGNYMLNINFGKAKNTYKVQKAN